MNTQVTSKQQIVLFIVATYTISWLMFWIGHQTEILPLIMLGVWTPSLTSVALTALLFGKSGVKKMFGRFKRYRVKWYWWMALLLLPAAIHFVGRSVWQLLYDGELNPYIRPIQYWASAIIPSFLIAGFGEELGWRGFVLPRLQQNFRPITATLIMAAVHMLWHMPTYWLGQGIHNVPFVFVLLFIFPWTFIFTWLYNKSGGSLIFAISFHAISNASLSIVRFLPLDSEVPTTPDLITQMSLPTELAGPYLAVCITYIVVAALVVFFGKFNEVNTNTP